MVAMPPSISPQSFASSSSSLKGVSPQATNSQASTAFNHTGDQVQFGGRMLTRAAVITGTGLLALTPSMLSSTSDTNNATDSTPKTTVSVCDRPSQPMPTLILTGQVEGQRKVTFQLRADGVNPGLLNRKDVQSAATQTVTSLLKNANPESTAWAWVVPSGKQDINSSDYKTQAFKLADGTQIKIAAVNAGPVRCPE